MAPPVNVIESTNSISTTKKEESNGVMENTKKEKFIIHYEGDQYDVAEFLDSHPAGRNVILPFRNRDMTNKFLEVGHSEEAKKILLKHKINKTPEDLEYLSQESGQRKLRVKTEFLVKKLITPEDPQYIHKILGFLALCSFAYRYFYVYPTTGNLGMNGSWFDYATLLVHFLLSYSSIIFHVLKKRMTSRPLIIYEEYRLHAIVFTGRAVGVSLIGLLCKDMDVIAKRTILAVFILLAHLIVDYITKVHGTKGVTAVRNDGVLKFKYIGLFYSFYQLAALGGQIIWNDRLPDLGYNTLIAIQSSAFLMTLKRKSLIRWYSHAIWYSIALALSYSVMFTTYGYKYFIYAAIVFFMRVQFNMDKYLLWTMYTISMYYFNLNA